MTPSDQPIISVQNLGKSYKLGLEAEKYPTFREAIVGAVKAPFRNLRDLSERASGEELFWAAKDISFDVYRGEVIGIIGRNGAGKSTLLKMLSRITEPTEGRIVMRGRVASLLEVGTGFHPELSGRENIFLNGSILGMRKVEIQRKFDEIVAFSEVEKFLDTPVKRYSSGMYVRLAFAVAAHLEPEILIVDEVLAVGDAEFQKKCLGKMQDVARGEGRTVIFVSHNMSAVQRLCSRGLLMRQGRMIKDGPVNDVVNEYLAMLTRTAETAFDADSPDRQGNGAVRFIGARALNEEGQPAKSLIAGKPAAFEFSYRNVRGVSKANIFFTIYNHLGIAVTNVDMNLTGFGPTELGAEGTATCRFPTIPLPLGQYRVAAAISVNGQIADMVPGALVFEVETSVFYETHHAPSIQFCTAMVAHEWSHVTSGPRPAAEQLSAV